MLERALTNKCCQEIIAMLLKKRGWTIARIARVVGASLDYVGRVRAGTQGFQMADVEALAKACRLQPHRLIFDSIPREKLSGEMQGLYQLGLQEIQRHEEFRRALMRKPTKKRRVRTKAA